MMKRILSVVVILTILVTCVGTVVLADTTDTATYGSGIYGDCSYGSCSLTLTSGGATSVDVIPTSTGRCTVQSDTVSVLTDSTAGYSLTASTNTTNNNMAGSVDNIGASSGTVALPVTLAMNTWGYRVDNLGGFGAGPTSAQSSGSVPSAAFAGVPSSNQSPATIASSVTAANPAVNTTVWYGVCADASLRADTYTTTVVYTAVTN